MSESELVLAIAIAFLASLEAWYYERKIRRIKKAALAGLLDDDKYDWRTLRVLQSAIADNRKSTEYLLLEIGARRSTDGQDLWTLKRRS